MSGKPRSLRQAQSLMAGQLRAQGRTWAEVAAEFRKAYRVNARVALRQARGWSQPQAAAQWTARWPDDPKTFKNFSYWELWPGGTGHAPSLDTLDRLAQLYGCSVADLLSDCNDYTPQPTARRAAAGPVAPPTAPDRAASSASRLAASSASLQAASSASLQAALERISAADISELARGSSGDSDSSLDSEPSLRHRRRMLLLEASSTLAVVAAAPVLEVPRRAGPACGRSLQAGPGMVGCTADVVAGLRRLCAAIGPRVTLPPAMALRSAMAAIARNAGETVTAQALTVYGDLTQLVGWLMFNLGDRGAARYYYDDARSAADRAGNADLMTYTLSASSQLATARGDLRGAIDHAHAAQQAAHNSGSTFAVAYAADITARAYAAAGQVARCHAALDRERAALGEIGPETPQATWWQFYDRAFYWGTESECALRLGMAVDASDAASRSLGLSAPANLHNSALTLAFQAEALIRQGEIDRACQTLADAARLATLNSSQRISRRIGGLRAQLRPAEHTAAVRELDEKLAAFRRARAAAEPA
jgi:transcriptional regulator with XRE-family HTH domain